MTLDRKVIPRIAFIVPVIAFAAYCGGGGPAAPPPTTPPPTGPPPTAVTVTMAAVPFRFIPPDVTVAVGGTVTWSNSSPVVHTVTSNTNAWASGPDLDPDATFQVTFPQAGTFDYRCTIHQGMIGTVKVQ